MINKLRQHFGRKCTSIYVNRDLPGFINIPLKQMKYCEAVVQSFKVPLQLNSGNLNCPGARRIMGFEKNDKQLAKEISENNHIPLGFIKTALQETPSLNGVININLGWTENHENDLHPDLFILYFHCHMITELMHKLAKMGTKPSILPYFFQSVCGNIFANSYLNDVVSISFGCPESRKSGGIGKNEIVIGLPFRIAVELLNFYE
ncbi:MAG: DUF169 domain-containing protein [Bacteroidales bacterium]|jgi:uncharacterized protein (DUF169 family)|nr:DUF169 domain-containing protein [Bacteroidales bacterium]